MVVDQAHDPGLLVLVDRASQVERALDVDVPELVGPTALVGRALLPSHRWPGGAELAQQAVDGMVVEGEDLAPGELGREALAVPVGEQADHDHRRPRPRPADDPDPDPAAGRVAPQDHPSRSRVRQRCRLARLDPERDVPPRCPLHAPPARSGRGSGLPPGPGRRARSRWATAPGGEEQEARAFLVGVAQETAMRLLAAPDRRLVHPLTLGRWLDHVSLTPGTTPRGPSVAGIGHHVRALDYVSPDDLEKDLLVRPCEGQDFGLGVRVGRSPTAHDRPMRPTYPNTDAWRQQGRSGRRDRRRWR